MQSDLFSLASVRNMIAIHLLHLRNRHYAIIDLLVFALIPALALYLRTDTLFHPTYFGWPLLVYIFVALPVRMGFFYYAGLYRRYWRFVSIFDFAQLVLTASLALLTTVIIVSLISSVAPSLYLPRSIPYIDAMLALLCAGGLRAGARLTENIRTDEHVQLRTQSTVHLRTLIAGAGYTGAQLAREIRDNHYIHLCLIGFVDDDPHKRGVHIHNVPVLGTCDNILQIIQRAQVERVIIAMPSASGKAIRTIVTACQQANVAVQTIPGLHELINGNVSISKLRNVQIEDLLRRTPVQTDTAAVRALLRGKRVLVTGGGGSIGSELCRQILRCQPQQLILLGHGENSIFEIQQELRRWQAKEQTMGNPTTTQLIPIIADLRFGERIKAIFAEHRPQVVFHAAAHKHVPLMEENPVEAITNNVLGTQHVLAAAAAYPIERFVMISTDKAVNPTNVMGASKRIAELLVLQAAQEQERFYQVVRFGNVLGSRGSVIHTFREQIANGGPVMVTHPEMVRYFMTIPEAVQLVLQAAVIGKGAEVLMLDMGEPVRIAQLAQDLIELSGLQVGRDIEITFSGLRPGEKLFEEMFKPDEAYMRTAHEKIFIAPNAAQMVQPTLGTAVAELTAAALRNDTATIFPQLSALLPEYHQWQPLTPSKISAPPQPESKATSPEWDRRFNISAAPGD